MSEASQEVKELRRALKGIRRDLKDLKSIQLETGKKIPSKWMTLTGQILPILGTIIAAFIAYLGTTQTNTPISCISERSQAADAYSAHKDAWIPLPDDDAIQVKCQINEYVDSLKKNP